MNKAQLIEKIAQQIGATKCQSEHILGAAFSIIQETVAKGEEVKIVGFGTFTQIQKKAKKGRNPKTGQEVLIPATRTPRFRPGKEFKDLLD